MKKTTLGLALLAMLFIAVAPQAALAAACSGNSNICDVIVVAGRMIDLLSGIVASLALLTFFWGLVKYIFAAGHEDSKASGKKIMFWGVIALFIMFSVFGLIYFLRSSFGINNIQNVPPPRVTF